MTTFSFYCVRCQKLMTIPESLEQTVTKEEGTVCRACQYKEKLDNGE